MQRVEVGNWGELTVYGWDEELPAPLSTGLPQFLERVPQCRPATLAFLRPNPISPPKPLGPFVAVWPTDALVPDTVPSRRAWTLGDIDGVLITQYTSLHCFVCGGNVPALYPDSGLPFSKNSGAIISLLAVLCAERRS